MCQPWRSLGVVASAICVQNGSAEVFVEGLAPLSVPTFAIIPVTAQRYDQQTLNLFSARGDAASGITDGEAKRDRERGGWLI